MSAVSRTTRTARRDCCGAASSRTTEALSEAALFEETVLGAWQAQILAQGLAFVFSAEEAAALQFGHDLVDEIVQAARHIREHDVEPVAGVAEQPFLHLIGDHHRGADER